MLLFWLCASVLIIAALAMLLPGLVRSKAVDATDGGAEKRAIFRQQFDELEQDKANGLLDAGQYASALNELERRLLSEVEDTEQVSILCSKPDRILAVATLVLFPLVAVLLYLKLGNPQAIVSPLAASMQSETGREASMAELESMLATLQQKLDKNPDDAKGWVVLARSLAQLQRYPQAVSAYEKATGLIKDDAQLLVDYAEAVGMANGRQLQGKPEELIQRALQIDPQNIKAILMKGAVKFERKAYAEAIADWEQASKLLPADATQMKTEVEAMLNEARKRAAALPEKLMPDKSNNIN